MSAHLYAFIEPALVGAGVVLALAATLRRYVGRRRASPGSACSSCSGCGGCASAGPAPAVRPILVQRGSRPAPE
jgi:hypothetical protein